MGVYLAVFKTFEYLYLGGGGQDVSLYPDDCGRINHTSKLCPSGRCSDIYRTTNYLQVKGGNSCARFQTGKKQFRFHIVKEKKFSLCCFCNNMMCFQKRNCILKEATSTKSNGSIVAFVVLLFAWETFVLSLQLERPTILYRKASVFTKREERRGTCKLYKAMALFSKIKNFKFRPNSERLVHACKEIIGICDLMCISAD